jgi:hypothetical protein
VRLTLAVTQLSVAVTAASVTTRLHIPAVALSVTSAGHVITGNSLSVTSTVKQHVAELLLLSTTLWHTDVCPTLKADPLAGPLLRVSTDPGQFSTTLGVV